ncbi:flavin reductase [Agrobacterium tumefaciens]|uniref:Flavin reductase n=1 Tax=Agrobacterium tumefaciens TaxID=358 RepID=A0A0D0JWM1_AGRTU|nr:flavin reductase [Agrobacterium tumefaciens]
MNIFTRSEFQEPRTRSVSDRPADSAGLKEALRTLGGGVSVITAGDGADRTGATITSATALSVDPPRMLVSLNRSSSTWPVVERYRHFAVNVIGADHQDVANRFSGVGGLKGAERYVGSEWTRLASGAPILEDAVAALDCEVEEAIERHSHVILIGRVLSIRIGGGSSLLYQNGKYHALT